ncbi:MAG: hypothetical protein ABEH43_10670, partial [Flavobacteriales bacterium]
HPKVDSSFKTNYQAWIFQNSSDPVFFFPTSDQQRYNKMKNSLTEQECWDENNSVNSNCDSKSLKEQLSESGNRSDLVSSGPYASLKPGESINVVHSVVLAKKYEDGNPNSANTKAQRKNLYNNAEWSQTAFNGEDVNFNGKLDEGEDKDNNGEITRYVLPEPPKIPNTRVETRDHAIDIYWSNNSESSIDPITRKKDFEGYKVYASKVGFDVRSKIELEKALKPVAQFDLAGNGKFFDTGLDSIRLDNPKVFENDTTEYNYKYTIDNIQNGWQYVVGVSAFDKGDEENELEPLESSILSNNFRAFAGTDPNEKIEKNKPFVYPNPYYGGASWEGESAFAEDKKIIFANLPKQCEIRIFTMAGDLIDKIEHNENYSGEDIQWFETFSNVENTEFSGGEHAWDLLSKDNQILSRGMYLFSVEDLNSGKIQKGKFVIIK